MYVRALSVCLLPMLFLTLQLGYVDVAVGQNTASYQKYVDKLFEAYDKNKDGDLDKAELSKMRRPPPAEADENGDGFVANEELVNYYASKNGSKRSSGNDKATQANASQGSAQINMAIVQFSDSASDEVDDFVAKYRGAESDSVVKELRRFVADKTNTTFDTLQFSAQLGSKTKMNIGSQEPKITGVTAVRGGGRSRQVSDYNIGTTLGIRAVRQDDVYLLSVDLEKSLVVDSDVVIAEHEDHETLASSFRNLSYESSIECEPGKTTLFTSSSAGSRWIVAISAK